MSSEIVFFSSSRRSMRSMMALSWSFANFVAGSSWTAAAAEVAIGYSLMELTVRLKDQAPHALPRGAFFRIDPQDRGGLRQGNIALIHSAPTGRYGHSVSFMPGLVPGIHVL